ncbi:MAG: MBL fold metallo-hydrolase [Actinobacteria bacterium]|nr:MBL fold metallo-hydrolase [Actinomycetota bacterium]
MRVGDIEIQPVHDGHATEPAREVLTRPDYPGDPWACHTDLLDAQGNLNLSLGGFLIRSSSRLILVDAGVGRVDNDKYHGGAFLDSLHLLGVSPEEVTDVVFTHLHFDHVGWATQKGRVVFPNAAYRVHTADWAHFVESPEANPGAVRKLVPLASQLIPFDRDTTIAPGLDTRHSPGHTPGSTVFVVSSQGERALLIGDIAHCVIELTDPTWEAVFDVNPTAARATRAILSDEVAGSPDALAAAHFPGLRFGRLITVEGKRRFVFI